MTGRLPTVEGLQAYWAAKTGKGPPRGEMQDRVLLDTLGLGNQQVLATLYSEQPDFAEFENWVWQTAGAPDPLLLDRYHAWLAGHAPGALAQAQLDAIAAMPPVLDTTALRHWDEHGYVVLPEAISANEIAAVTALLWQVIDASPDDPASWAQAKTDGIMVPYFQHSALEAARRSPRIHKAFAQLWGSENLWVTIDRMGFNPPIECGRAFMGSDLHWDVSLARPIPFGTQAVLYLSDTGKEEGAFRCVPGFHRRIELWLEGLGETDPRAVDLSADTKYVAGRTGDLIIWHQALPHGASPNHGTTPRLAQYLNFYSPDMVVRGEWR
jgi:Phytanoyl-CoA dioxygenase (PhyH)